jgi:predicted RNA-binding Zn-ribbon protein involved in translation (DUF1610 family)
MPYYICPRCGKITMQKSMGELAITETCKNCGNVGKLNLVILRQDKRED